jgi:hypothetical protein
MGEANKTNEGSGFEAIFLIEIEQAMADDFVFGAVEHQNHEYICAIGADQNMLELSVWLAINVFNLAFGTITVLKVRGFYGIKILPEVEGRRFTGCCTDHAFAKRFLEFFFGK